MDDDTWNNGYLRAHETAKLLENLERGPMTDDEIDRSFLELSLLTGEQNGQIHEGLTEALWDYFRNFGKSEALGRWMAAQEGREEEWRRTVPWDKIPGHVADLTRRRSHFITGYAESEGWIARTACGTRWRITTKGLESLRSGLFTIR